MCAQKVHKEEKLTPLATGVIVKNKLIQIYDLCNDYDNITMDSDFFKKFKNFILLHKKNIDKESANDNVDEDVFNRLLDKESLFSKLNFFDKNGDLIEENLFKEVKKSLEIQRDKKIKAVLEEINSNSSYKNSWDKALNNLGLKNVDVLKANSARGNADQLREALYSDYELLKMIEPVYSSVEDVKSSIEQQVDALPYFVHWVKASPDVNKEIRTYFHCTKKEGIPVPRKEFLTFVGKMLAIGDELTDHNRLKPDEVPSRESVRTSYYDDIREACGKPNLTNAEISLAAVKAYKVAAEGLWKHKNKVNKDKDSEVLGKVKANPGETMEEARKRVKKDNYMRANVFNWINAMIDGRNDIAKLAFLKDTKEDNEYSNYLRSTDDMWKAEINAKHVTVDHFFDLKYHGMFDKLQDKKLLNDLWNLTLVIGGSVHKEKTDESENSENKQETESGRYYRVKVDKVPNIPLVMTYDNRKSYIERTEPDIITKLRAGKGPTGNSQGPNIRDTYDNMRDNDRD